MPIKYIGALVFLWIVAAMVGAIIEGATLSANETGTLHDLTSWQEVKTTESWGAFRAIGALPGFFSSLFTIMTFNFAFFDGQWELVRWIILVPLMVTVVFGLIVTFLGIFQRSV